MINHHIYFSSDLQKYPKSITWRIFQTWKHERIHAFINQFFGFSSEICYYLFLSKKTVIYSGFTIVTNENQSSWKILWYFLGSFFIHLCFDLFSDMKNFFLPKKNQLKSALEVRALAFIIHEIQNIKDWIIHPGLSLTKFRKYFSQDLILEFMQESWTIQNENLQSHSAKWYFSNP